MTEQTDEVLALTLTCSQGSTQPVAVVTVTCRAVPAGATSNKPIVDDQIGA